ncbi:FecR family protein [Sphingomonas gellani]|uniref:FecR family protein n=1 Tax=Sphingomonas gellani TaxID=1166340 RepID=A0A1H8CVY5_9SPHN|nr:FecR domain-containing protein [Sphingomonas gellani]SEM98327.1 FecR family protein [Sphingomonas gellani]
MTTHLPNDPAAAAARWYARLRSDAPTDGDAEAFDTWIDANPAHRVAWERLEQVDATLPSLASDPAIAALRADALRPTPARFPSWRIAGAAAAMAASVAMVTIVALKPHGGAERAEQVAAAPVVTRYQTGLGEMRTVRLADGTAMTMDARSVVRAAAPGVTRQVAVDAGRAMFAVAKDRAHPFIVSVGETRVMALGTHFSVERRGDGAVVALTEGSVRVRTPVATRTLVPGQVLTARATTVRVDDGAADESGWVEGRLVFTAVPLGDVAATLNRYAQRQVVIRDAGLAARPYSGVLRAKGGADALVAVLTTTGAARVTSRDGASVTLEPR